MSTVNSNNWLTIIILSETLTITNVANHPHDWKLAMCFSCSVKSKSVTVYVFMGITKVGYIVSVIKGEKWEGAKILLENFVRGGGEPFHISWKPMFYCGMLFS